MTIRSSRYPPAFPWALLVLALLAAAPGCARARPTGTVIGSSELPAPALERLSSTGATITVARPAYVALVELGPDGPRLVYPGGTMDPADSPAERIASASRRVAAWRSGPPRPARCA